MIALLLFSHFPEDNIGKPLRMSRTKITMIRSATQQQQMFLRPIHNPNCSRYFTSEGSALHFNCSTRAAERQSWLFIKKEFKSICQLTGWTAKILLAQNISSNDNWSKLSCSERLSSDQKSRIWIDDQFSERAKWSISGTPNARMNDLPRTSMPVAMAMEFVCRPTDQRLGDN